MFEPKDDIASARRLECEKAGNLKENWKQLRLCKTFLMGNSEIWLPISEKETKWLDRAGNETRLKMQKQKRVRFGKAGNIKLTNAEDEQLVLEIKERKELNEIRDNIWRLNDKRKVEQKRPTSKVPVGRKSMKDATRKPISEYFRKGCGTDQAMKSSIKTKLDIMQISLDYITKHEVWLVDEKDL